MKTKQEISVMVSVYQDNIEISVLEVEGQLVDVSTIC